MKLTWSVKTAYLIMFSYCLLCQAPHVSIFLQLFDVRNQHINLVLRCLPSSYRNAAYHLRLQNNTFAASPCFCCSVRITNCWLVKLSTANGTPLSSNAFLICIASASARFAALKILAALQHRCKLQSHQPAFRKYCTILLHVGLKAILQILRSNNERLAEQSATLCSRQYKIHPSIPQNPSK